MTAIRTEAPSCCCFPLSVIVALLHSCTNIAAKTLSQVVVFERGWLEFGKNYQQVSALSGCLDVAVLQGRT